MENKKERKKLSLQKMKITKLDRSSLQRVKGGNTENEMDFSNTLCPTDTCPESNEFTCDAPSDECTGSNGCRTQERFCTGYN